MKKLGFAKRWINLMMICFTSPMFSILVNGVPRGTIIPS